MKQSCSNCKYNRGYEQVFGSWRLVCDIYGTINPHDIDKCTYWVIRDSER